MSNKEKILALYYNEHLKQNEIAKIVNTTTQYVSKVVRADERNKAEKENRKNVNAKNRKVYMQEYFKNYERKSKTDNSYKQLQALLNQDSKELSYHSEISDYSFAKWNSSVYHRDSKGNLRLNRNVKTGFDVPKYINMNIKVPTQKYKSKYVYSY